MGAISATLKLNDGMSPVMRHMNTALNMVLNSFEAVQSASGRSIDTQAIQAAREELANAAVALEEAEENAARFGRSTEELADHAERACSGFTVMKAALANLAADAVGKVASHLKGAASDAVDFASDLAEVQNVVDVTFGEQNRIINGWSRKTLDAFGLNELSAKRYSSTMGAMLKSSGVSGGALLAMSKNITQLSGDMASFYNLDNDTAFEKIRSGISGETEPLKQLGINMSVANMNAFAMSQGLEKTYDKMSQGEQVLLRYQYLMAQTADAQGDFARTQDSYANQTKLMEENWKALTGSVAGLFLPALANAASSINDLLVKAQQLVPAVQKFLAPAEKGASAIGRLGEAISNNWGIVSAVIGTAAAALAWYLFLTKGTAAATAIWNGIQKAGTAIMTAFHAVQTFVSIGWGMLTGNTAAASAAMMVYKKALLACPLTWILIALTAVIAVLYLGVAAWNKWTGQSVSATGIIVGALNVLKQFVINMFALWWNRVAAFVNFFANVWNDPVAAVKILFLDLANSVIGYVLKMAEAIESIINKIPGVQVDITGGLDGFQKKIEDASAKIKAESEWKEVVSPMEYGSYGDAFSKGYASGKSLADKVSNFDLMEALGIDLSGNSDMPAYDTSTYEELLDGINTGVATTADNTGKSLDISEENLKYMRDLAEQETVNRFTTAEIKVDMVNNNSISSNMDLDGAMDYLVNGVESAMEQAAEGVHE